MRKSKNSISSWLKEHGDPEIDRFIEKNLAIVEKVRIALQNKGWSKAQLAEAMGKKPSEVSKWLTGMHNLTLKSTIKMEMALGIDLIHTEPVKEYEYVFLGTIENKDELKTKGEEYTVSCLSQEYEIAM
ncbi:helix-turn-helix domain-containing protein [Sunxiuqinia rutila]|uniref:helix-turn-helix domain-containing protein n=1 Tax=Sunxiuqinia rutila TaxID=1397841 RepID=UPI003D361F74